MADVPSTKNNENELSEMSERKVTDAGGILSACSLTIVVIQGHLFGVDLKRRHGDGSRDAQSARQRHAATRFAAQRLRSTLSSRLRW